jgi:hypothetical protein
MRLRPPKFDSKANIPFTRKVLDETIEQPVHSP